MTLQGCASFNPKPIDRVQFKQHAQTKTDGVIRVTCAILTNEESQAIFDMDLAHRLIQAVWIEVENNDDRPYWLLSTVVDPHYLAPDEFGLAKSLCSFTKGTSLRLTFVERSGQKRKQETGRRHQNERQTIPPAQEATVWKDSQQ
jgi:hypothetical protein